MKIQQIALSFAAIGFVTWNGNLLAAEPPTDAASPSAVVEDTTQPEHFRKFAERLSNARLVGNFTIVGKEGPMSKEEYTIHRVEKVDRDDVWLFHARIRYGKINVTLPLPLEVKWAGDTPVITLSDLAIPGLGTFSARVVIDQDKYAGTWTHGEVSGHMFGTIKPIEATE